VIPLIAAELAFSTVGAILFVVLYMRPLIHRFPADAYDRQVILHLAAFTLGGAVEYGALFGVTLGIVPPLWVFVVVYGLLDGLVAWRLWFVLRRPHYPSPPLTPTCEETE
jgi:hypothetical protein